MQLTAPADSEYSDATMVDPREPSSPLATERTISPFGRRPSPAKQRFGEEAEEADDRPLLARTDDDHGRRKSFKLRGLNRSPQRIRTDDDYISSLRDTMKHRSDQEPREQRLNRSFRGLSKSPMKRRGEEEGQPRMRRSRSLKGLHSSPSRRRQEDSDLDQSSSSRENRLRSSEHKPRMRKSRSLRGLDSSDSTSKRRSDKDSNNSEQSDSTSKRRSDKDSNNSEQQHRYPRTRSPGRTGLPLRERDSQKSSNKRAGKGKSRMDSPTRHSSKTYHGEKDSSSRKSERNNKERKQRHKSEPVMSSRPTRSSRHRERSSTPRRSLPSYFEFASVLEDYNRLDGLVKSKRKSGVEKNEKASILYNQGSLYCHARQEGSSQSRSSPPVKNKACMEDYTESTTSSDFSYESEIVQTSLTEMLQESCLSVEHFPVNDHEPSILEGNDKVFFPLE